jgi:hypothetical protein
VAVAGQEVPLRARYGCGEDLGLLTSDDRVVPAVPDIHRGGDRLQADAPWKRFKPQVVRGAAPADAARFYSGLFGWQTEDTMPPDAGAHYYMARIDGRDAAGISSQPPGAPPQAVWNTYIRVESADHAATGHPA